jgi:hypothetical protein
MRLAPYAVAGGEPVLGVIFGGRIQSLEATIPNLPGDLRSSIARWSELRTLVGQAAGRSQRETLLARCLKRQ